LAKVRSDRTAGTNLRSRPKLLETAYLGTEKDQGLCSPEVKGEKGVGVGVPPASWGRVWSKIKR